MKTYRFEIERPAGVPMDKNELCRNAGIWSEHGGAVKQGGEPRRTRIVSEEDDSRIYVDVDIDEQGSPKLSIEPFRFAELPKWERGSE